MLKSSGLCVLEPRRSYVRTYIILIVIVKWHRIEPHKDKATSSAIFYWGVLLFYAFPGKLNRILTQLAVCDRSV